MLGETDDAAITDSETFKSKVKITVKPLIMVIQRMLNRSAIEILAMPLIDWEIELFPIQQVQEHLQQPMLNFMFQL